MLFNQNKNQGGFTRANFLRQQKDSGGFIPMLILLVIVLGAVVWFSFKHVYDARKAKTVVNQINNVRTNENLINR